jgi:hypothetical protein
LLKLRKSLSIVKIGIFSSFVEIPSVILHIFLCGFNNRIFEIGNETEFGCVAVRVLPYDRHAYRGRVEAGVARVDAEQQDGPSRDFREYFDASGFVGLAPASGRNPLLWEDVAPRSHGRPFLSKDWKSLRFHNVQPSGS